MLRFLLRSGKIDPRFPHCLHAQVTKTPSGSMAQETPHTSTSEKLNQFLEETQIPMEMSLRSASPGISAQSSLIFPGDSAHMASTPKFDLSIESEGNQNSSRTEIKAPAEDTNDLPNLSYKSRLQYIPSKSFVGETTTMNGASLPNTFKHKSHPNAKTKSHIMLSAVEEKLSSVMEGEPNKTALSQGRLQEPLHHTASQNELKDLLPLYLNESWKERYSEILDNKGKPLPELRDRLEPLDFLNNGGETLVHKKSHGRPIPTADWKKAQKESEVFRVSRPLDHIFISNGNSKISNDEEKLELDKASGVRYSSMSDSSSEFLRTSFTRLTQKQVESIETLLEQNKDKPETHAIQTGSPLKLFGREYDTFTKGFLYGIVQDASSSAPRPTSITQRQRPPPRKPSTGIVNRSTKNFLDNANKLYENIRNIPVPYRLNNNSPFENLHADKTDTLSEKRDTDTSTPKGRQEFSRHTNIALYQSYEFSSEVSSGFKSEQSYSDDTKNSNLLDSHDSVSLDLDRPAYTIEESRDSIFFNSEPNYNRKTMQEKFLEPSLSRSLSRDFSSLISSQENLEQPFIPARGLRKLRNQSPITPKWKTPKDLRNILNSVNQPAPQVDAVLKGTVKHGWFPERYGSMIINKESHRWEHDKENVLDSDLDSFQDLSVASVKAAGILRAGRLAATRITKGLEVSFMTSDGLTSLLTIDCEHAAASTTQVSELQDISFSQTGRNVVSLITDATEETDWKTVTFIDLSGREIEQVSGLKTHLPALRRLNLSKNRIRHLEGLPNSLFELEVSNNKLRELVSFQKFRDLQFLSAQNNLLSSISCFSHNIHLTLLNLAGNRIKSLAGLRSLNNLTSLNLRQNFLVGAIDFKSFDLPKLQDLNLEANSITAVDGLEDFTKLRVLNLSENKLTEFNCRSPLSNLKKLILSLNRLKTLDVHHYPNLRVLRIDGNKLRHVLGLEKLLHLWEVSSKFQNTAEVTGLICEKIPDISKLDLSGNSFFLSCNFYKNRISQFLNVNELSLQVLNLRSVPEDISLKFPNVRALNLSFNKIDDLLGLSDLCRLKELRLLSNNLAAIKPILTSLKNCKKSLKVLDLKLNPLTLKFYPDVLEFYQRNNRKNLANSSSSATKNSLALDDMESFADVSRVSEENKSQWQAQDDAFVARLVSSNQMDRYESKLDYEALFIQYFPSLEELDGLPITEEKGKAAKQQAKKKSRIRA